MSYSLVSVGSDESEDVRTENVTPRYRSNMASIVVVTGKAIQRILHVLSFVYMSSEKLQLVSVRK